MFGDGLNPIYTNKKTVRPSSSPLSTSWGLIPFTLPLIQKPFLWLYPKMLLDADFLPTYNTPLTSRLISTPIDSPRLDYFTWILQDPRFIDILTGHKGLNAKLQALKNPTLEEKMAAIPEDSRCLFPLFNVNENFPPTFFIHGDKDEAVPIEESRLFFATLQGLKVDTRMVEVPGGNHDCDWVKDSSEVKGLSGVVPWLLTVLA